MDYLYHDGHARPLLYDIKRSGIEFDSYTSTASYEIVFEWVTKYMGKKYLRFTASDNPVLVRLTGSLDGVNYDYPIQVSTVGTSTPVLIEIDQFFATIKIEAVDVDSGSHGVLDAILTATSQPTSGPMDGSNSVGKRAVFSGTTSTNAYVVMGTMIVAGYIAVTNSITVTTNDLLFKFEYTRDGVTWYSSISDYPIAAGNTATLSAVRNAYMYRVSVKPAVNDTHGSYEWVLTTSSVVLPPEYRSAFAYESIDVTSAHAEGFTIATMDGAVAANITVENNSVRARWDGTDPETDEGHLLAPGDQIKLDFTADLYHFRAIATGGDAILRVTYSR